MKGMKTQYQIDVERNAHILRRDRRSYLEAMFGRFMRVILQSAFLIAVATFVMLVLLLIAR
jgi:hypothetical protein